MDMTIYKLKSYFPLVVMLPQQIITGNILILKDSHLKLGSSVTIGRGYDVIGCKVSDWPPSGVKNSRDGHCVFHEFICRVATKSQRLTGVYDNYKLK